MFKPMAQDGFFDGYICWHIWRNKLPVIRLVVFVKQRSEKRNAHLVVLLTSTSKGGRGLLRGHDIRERDRGRVVWGVRLSSPSSMGKRWRMKSKLEGGLQTTERGRKL